MRIINFNKKDANPRYQAFYELESESNAKRILAIFLGPVREMDRGAGLYIIRGNIVVLDMNNEKGRDILAEKLKEAILKK